MGQISEPLYQLPFRGKRQVLVLGWDWMLPLTS